MTQETDRPHQPLPPDGQQPARPRKAAVPVRFLQRLMEWLPGLAVGFALTYLLLDREIAPAFLPAPGFVGVILAARNPTADLLAVVVAAYLTILLHELGHAAAAAVAHHRLVAFRVGPAALVRLPKGWRGRLDHTAWSLVSGQVGTGAVGMRALNRRYALVLLGGPLANLATALLIAALLPALRHYPVLLEWRSWWLDALLVQVARLSFVSALANLVPLRFGAGLLSDGAQLLGLVRRPGEFRRGLAYWSYWAGASAGLKRRDADPAALERLITPADRSYLEAVGHWGLHERALDRGDIEVAGPHLERVLALEEVLPPVQRPNLHRSAAYYFALRGNAVEARRHLGLGEGSPDEPQFWLLCQAAVLLAEGDAVGARAKAEEGLATLERSSWERVDGSTGDWLRGVLGRSSDRLGGEA